jgi:ribonuclease HI
MELRAVYELLRATPPDLALHIQIDSQYVMNTFTSWVITWRANGWRTASRKPVASRANIEMIANLLELRDVTWEHVRGHNGHLLNEVVDRRARAAAMAVQNASTVDSGPGLRTTLEP